jgi:hypothetical protein
MAQGSAGKPHAWAENCFVDFAGGEAVLNVPESHFGNSSGV